MAIMGVDDSRLQVNSRLLRWTCDSTSGVVVLQAPQVDSWLKSF